MTKRSSRLLSEFLDPAVMAESSHFLSCASFCVPWLRVISIGHQFHLNRRSGLTPVALDEVYIGLHRHALSLRVAELTQNHTPFGNLGSEISLNFPKCPQEDDWRPLGGLYSSCAALGRLARPSADAPKAPDLSVFAHYLLTQCAMHALSSRQAPPAEIPPELLVLPLPQLAKKTIPTPPAAPASATKIKLIPVPHIRGQKFNVDDFLYSLPGKTYFETTI